MNEELVRELVSDARKALDKAGCRQELQSNGPDEGPTCICDLCSARVDLDLALREMEPQPATEPAF